MSTISPLTNSSPAQPSAASTSGTGSLLSQNNFMQLMIAQMKNQNPTSPTSTTDFVTQLAQFSSVQGMTQLNASISSMVSMQGLSQAVGLIGKTVTYTNASGSTASGTVNSVAMVGGQAQLVINNTNVNVSQIQSVQAAAKKSTTAASNSSGS